MLNANAPAFHTKEELEFFEQAYKESKIPDDIDTADCGPGTVFYTINDHRAFMDANPALIAK